MDYEKKYKEALERARELAESNPSDEGIQKYVQDAFPELKESEDERIRKEIIEYFKHYSGGDNVSIKFPEWIAWLEKKGEQKPVDTVEPKFKFGDWVVVNDGRIGRISECTKDFADVNFEFSRLFTRVNNIRFWTIQDAKDGDVLVNWNNTIYLFKGIEDEVVKFYCYYNANYEKFDTPFDNNSHLGLTEPQFDHHPATKEQRDMLFQKMKEAGYEWDVEKKKLKKIEESNTDGCPC